MLMSSSIQQLKPFEMVLVKNNVILKLCAYMGVFPFYSESERSFTCKRTYNYMIFVLLFALHVWVLYLNVNDKIENVGDVTNVYLVTLSFWALYVVLVCLGATHWNFECVVSLFENFNEIDVLLARLHVNKIPAVEKLGLKFGNVFCGQFLLHLFFGYVFSIAVLHLSDVVRFFFDAQYSFVCMSLQYYLLDSICVRLSSLNSVMNNIGYSNKYLDIVEKYIDHVTAVYGVVCKLVTTYNDLFGWSLFLQIILTYANIFSMISSLLFRESDILSSYEAIFCVFYAFSTIVIVITFVVKCEQLKRELLRSSTIASDVMRKSFKLRSALNVGWMLTHETSTKQPRISAAGVFLVDYPMLFMLVNLFATYIIVLFQFVARQSIESKLS